MQRESLPGIHLRGLIFRITKNSKTVKRANDQIKEWAIRLNREFSKEIKMTLKHKNVQHP